MLTRLLALRNNRVQSFRRDNFSFEAKSGVEGEDSSDQGGRTRSTTGINGGRHGRWVTDY